MEMTIEEIIKELEWALANNTIEDVESAFKYISAIHMAIDTMRKYQKIEEIMNREYTLLDMVYCIPEKLHDIREVLEDGNN